MHGLIFETSIWLLAGSTRYLCWIREIDEKTTRSPTRQRSEKSQTLGFNPYHFTCFFEEQVPTNKKVATYERSPLRKRKAHILSFFGFLNLHSRNHDLDESVVEKVNVFALRHHGEARYSIKTGFQNGLLRCKLRKEKQMWLHLSFAYLQQDKNTMYTLIR